MTSVRKAFGPKVSLVDQLALYTTFHRSNANKLAHAVGVPIVLFSALPLWAYLRLPTSHSPLAHIGTLWAILGCGALATVDALGAALLFALFVPGCLLAGLCVAAWPAWAIVPVTSAVQMGGWWATVIVGHGRFEPPLSVGRRQEDSNLYFRRRYHLARDIGYRVSTIDRVVQFCIAPLSVLQDGFTMFGLRRTLESAIGQRREQVLKRLASGESPLP